MKMAGRTIQADEVLTEELIDRGTEVVIIAAETMSRQISYNV